MNSGDKKILNKSIVILLIVVAAFVIVLIIAGKNGTKMDTFTGNVGQNDISEMKKAIIKIDNKHLVAAVADREETRALGLSGTHFLNEQSGMWFVFEEADKHGFWMKDTKFALDIIWVDSSGKIVHMEENVQPESYPKVFTPPVPAQYVLEVGAGYAERNDIKIGDTINVTPIAP